MLASDSSHVEISKGPSSPYGVLASSKSPSHSPTSKGTGVLTTPRRMAQKFLFPECGWSEASVTSPTLGKVPANLSNIGYSRHGHGWGPLDHFCSVSGAVPKEMTFCSARVVCPNYPMWKPSIGTSDLPW